MAQSGDVCMAGTMDMVLPNGTRITLRDKRLAIVTADADVPELAPPPVFTTFDLTVVCVPMPPRLEMCMHVVSLTLRHALFDADVAEALTYMRSLDHLSLIACSVPSGLRLASTSCTTLNFAPCIPRGDVVLDMPALRHFALDLARRCVYLDGGLCVSQGDPAGWTVRNLDTAHFTTFVYTCAAAHLAAAAARPDLLPATSTTVTLGVAPVSGKFFFTAPSDHEGDGVPTAAAEITTHNLDALPACPCAAERVFLGPADGIGTLLTMLVQRTGARLVLEDVAPYLLGIKRLAAVKPARALQALTSRITVEFDVFAGDVLRLQTRRLRGLHTVVAPVWFPHRAETHALVLPDR